MRLGCGLGGRKVEACAESGAPCGEKHVVLWQPPMESTEDGEEVMRSTYLEAADILADLVKAGLKTLAFVPARKVRLARLLAAPRRSESVPGAWDI